MVITLQAITLFEFDESVISTEGRKKLDDEVIGKLKGYTQIELVLVTGHADRIGTDAYNQRLSRRRADAVNDYLVEQGIDANSIETAANDESELVVTCDEVQGKASGRNRELSERLKPNRVVIPTRRLVTTDEGVSPFPQPLSRRGRGDITPAYPLNISLHLTASPPISN